MFCFYPKWDKNTRVTVCLQLRDEVEVKSDDVRSDMPRYYALHACLCQTKYIANFKIYERAYHASKFSGE